MRNLFLLLFAGLMAVSCEGPMGPPGLPGEDGEPGASWDVKDFVINNWTENREAGYFYSHFNFPELNNFIYNEGIVIAYIEFDGSYQTPLPYERYKEMWIEGVPYRWSELIDFEYAKGEISFYLTPSDFDTAADMPDPATIRVVLLW
ncbi:MAG TPA: hypothetical protein DDW62_12485 [Marinilabiliaceae bacterium]|jgi:hypothetical protein|nr:hypothetical protein [Marinilabiliaceae bacterium]